MDARRGQVYTGIYQFEGTEMQTIKEQCIMMLEDLIEELDKSKENSENLIRFLRISLKKDLSVVMFYI